MLSQAPAPRLSEAVLLLSVPGLLLVSGVYPSVFAQEAPPPGAVRIGLMRSLFRGLPEPVLKASLPPFRVLVEAQTGVPGQLVAVGEVSEMAERLDRADLHLGVFHGIEFAWAREHYPDLRPLVLAVNQQRHLRACLLVGAGSTARDFASLRGQALALPLGTREHCRLFLERQCRVQGEAPADFFQRLTTPPTAEDALDDVVDGVVAATVVDELAVEAFRRRKPGRYARLHQALVSETFPAAVIAYRAGALGGETLGRFRQGLLDAPRHPRAQQLLTLWKLTGFEEVPADYEQTLAAILQAYPPPADLCRPVVRALEGTR